MVNGPLGPWKGAIKGRLMDNKFSSVDIFTRKDGSRLVVELQKLKCGRLLLHG